MENTIQNIQKRSYQLDFLKLLFALFIFWTHTAQFIGENTRISLPIELGSLSVHFFFIVSGMLMVNSIMKQGNNIPSPGKSAISFVIKKYKSIGWQFVVSLIICVCVTIICDEAMLSAVKSVIWLIPELFLVSSSGIWLFCNGPVWYLSAMLICMLPLAYLLYKKRDFTLYVFAPLTAILTLGYMCMSNNWMFIAHTELYGFVMGSVIRGMSGLCFGICAWTIYDRIKNANPNKKVRVLLTATEVLLYFTFFWVWMIMGSKPSIMAVVIILPIAVSITFSGKSYVSSLFKYRWMRYFGPISLSIYLNHRAAAKLVEATLDGESYKICVAAMAGLTLVFCLLNFFLVTLGKCFWKNKLKAFFTEPDKV